MEKETLVQRNDEENFIPTIWREVFFNIVEALKERKLRDLNEILGVYCISEEEFDGLIDNINNYGCNLVSLPKESWDTSVCRWYGDNGWDALIDLFTVEEGRSDLVLDICIKESEDKFYFKIIDVYVP